MQAVVQLERLQQINLPPNLFASVSPKVVFRFRQRAAVEGQSKLRRHPAQIRYTLLAAFCWCRSAEITDDLVECLNILVHKMGARAERRIYKELLEDLKRVSGKNNLLFQIAEASLDKPDGSVKEVIYPVVDEQTLRDLVVEYRSSGPAYRTVVHTVMRNSYSKHYRRMVPKLLRVLDFRSNNTAQQPIIDAISLLRKYTYSQQVYYPADEVIPIDSVVRPSLASLVIELNKKGEPRINRINYEKIASPLRFATGNVRPFEPA